MEQERAEAHEALRRERADIARELELRKHELEMNIQKKQEDNEKKLRDKQSVFDRRSELQLNHIKSESSLNESNIRKLKVEQEQLEREKNQLSSYGEKVEADQLEVQKNITTLRLLNKNQKDQREEFIKERECSLALVEQCKVFKNCGVQISELQPLGLQPITEIQNARNVLLPTLADGFVEERPEFKNTGASPSSARFQPVNSGRGKYPICGVFLEQKLMLKPITSHLHPIKMQKMPKGRNLAVEQCKITSQKDLIKLEMNQSYLLESLTFLLKPRGLKP